MQVIQKGGHVIILAGDNKVQDMIVFLMYKKLIEKIGRED